MLDGIQPKGTAMNSRSLERVDLIDPSVDFTQQELEDYVRNALDYATEHSAGFGLSRDQRIFVTLARCLYSALIAAEKADETQRSLKGEQLAHGRTKKKLERSDEEVIDLSKQVSQLQRDLADAHAALSNLPDAGNKPDSA